MIDPSRVPLRIALDLETRDPGLDAHGPGWAWSGGGHVFGCALAWEGHSVYLPWRGRNVAWIRDVLADPRRQVVMFNAHYDLGWLRRSDVAVRGPVYDTMFAAALLNEYRRRYNLDAVGRTYLQRGKNEDGLVEWARRHGLNPKRDMWKAPPEVVAPYAKQDAELTRDLYPVLQKLIAQEELESVLDMEHRLIPVVQEMRWRGIRVDVDRAERLSRQMAQQQGTALKELQSLAGRSDASATAPSVLTQMFDDWGIAYPRTEKGNPSFVKTWLETLNHPGVDLIRRIRRLEKVRSTFVDGLLKHVQSDGRVHGELIQMPSDDGGTVTGRFSSAHPNLQNQPARDPELGPLVRSLFLPEEGQHWAACDYSQQEPRLMVHYASEVRVRGAAAAMDAYRTNPDTDFHQFVAELTGLPRSQAKIINLGLAYGMGGAKLCLSLNLPIEPVYDGDGKVKFYKAGPEGQALLDQYHHHAPFIRGLTDACSRRAARRGWIRTLGGRKCRFTWQGNPDPDKENWAYPYQAMNRLIQGSAADQTKKAMLALWEQGIVPLVQVHDELGLSVDEGDADTLRRVQETMEYCVTLCVPSKVDVDVGLNWGDSM